MTHPAPPPALVSAVRHRLVGVDVARGAALLAMMAVHVVPATSGGRVDPLHLAFGGWRYTVDLQTERAKAIASEAEAVKQRKEAENLIELMLGDLRNTAKRAAYLDMGECWYVLGCDARGRCIAAPDEVPPECGVLVLEHGRLVLARAAPRRSRSGLPFGVWMALAKAAPVAGLDEGAQPLLGLAA